MNVQSSPAMRTDDSARREVAETLARHMSDGRLTLGEYEDRLEQTFSAVTESDLSQVLHDLPKVQTSAEERRRRRSARSAMVGWLGLCALFITIWALSGAGYFWPIWPMFGTGMGTLPRAYALWTGAADSSDATPRPHDVSRRGCGGRSRSR